MQLSDHDLREARFSLLDTLACTIVGTKERQPQAATDAVLFGEQTGPVLPIGGGAGVSLMSATLINGARAHALDFDDYEQLGGSHVSAPIYSALFALSRVQPLTVDEICNAWVVGYEAVIWMASAVGYHHYEKGWHSTLTLGPIGVAAAVARALRLPAEQMSVAMAIAASSSSGLKAQFGTDAKALHVGFASEAGLRAALLARAGATANTALWHGVYGFGSLYDADVAKGFDTVLRTMQLGQALSKHPVCRKLWPSCGYTHRVIAGAEKLYQRLDRDDEVASILVRMPEPFHRVAGFAKPMSDAEARFSVSYCVAAGVLAGHVTPDDFRERNYSDAVRTGLSTKVKMDLYDLPKGDIGEIGQSNPEAVKVTLSNGQVLEEIVEFLPGGAENPMTTDQLLQKIADCSCSTERAVQFLHADGVTPLQETGILDQLAGG